MSIDNANADELEKKLALNQLTGEIFSVLRGTEKREDKKAKISTIYKTYFPEQQLDSRDVDSMLFMAGHVDDKLQRETLEIFLKTISSPKRRIHYPEKNERSMAAILSAIGNQTKTDIKKAL